MKEFLKNILTKIKDTGIVTVDVSFLKDNSWFYITDEVFLKKIVYIFRNNGELLISTDGDITRAKWEELIHSTNSLILEIDQRATLYNIIYLTSEYLIVLKDGTEEIKVFIKQQRYISKFSSGLMENHATDVLNDLNHVLNEKNTNIFPLNNQLSAGKSRQSLPQYKEYYSPEYYTMLENISDFFIEATGYRENIEYHYFHRLRALDLFSKRNGGLSKNQEVEIIIKIMEIEDELIEDRLMCKNCKAVHSINGGFCHACKKHISG